MVNAALYLALCALGINAEMLEDAARKAYEKSQGPSEVSRAFTASTEHRCPHTLVFSCSDSRVDPQLIFNAKPSEIYSFRVPGNIVSVAESSSTDTQAQAVSHILRSALDDMKVDVIAVLGHTECSTIQSLSREKGEPSEWAKTAGPVAERVSADYDALSKTQKANAFVAENVRLQRERLLARADVQKALAQGQLKSVEAYVYELGPKERGIVSKWDDKAQRFVTVAGHHSQLPKRKKMTFPAP